MDSSMIIENSKNAMKLPMKTNPEYQSYDYIAFISGIIGSSFENSESWVCSNVLDLSFGNNSLWIINREYSFLNTGPIITNKINLYLYDILYNPNRLISMLKSLIQNNWYIEGSFNEIVIPEKSSYKIRDNLHSFFLYGYDEIGQHFYAVGHTRTGQFESYEINYTTLFESICLNRQDIIPLFLYKANNSFVCSFDSNKVYQSVGNYLISRNYYCDSNEKASFGLNALRNYIEYLRNNYTSGRKIDLRNSRLLSENKKVLFKALQKIPFYSSIPDKKEIEKIYDGFIQHHYLALKYNLSGDRTILQNVFIRLEELIESEKRFLQLIEHYSLEGGICHNVT